jgi:hypothetical protein
MPEQKDITYKNLCFKINPEFDYLEILVDDVNFSDQKSYIASVSILLEFALSVHPRYIFLNKLESEFKIIPELYQFTSKNIIEPLKTDGVRRIICLASENECQTHYSKIERIEPFIKGFSSREEAILWISGNE